MSDQIHAPTELRFGIPLMDKCRAKARKTAGQFMKKGKKPLSREKLAESTKQNEAILDHCVNIGFSSNADGILRSLWSTGNPPAGIDSIAALKAIIASLEEKTKGMNTDLWRAKVAISKAVIAMNLTPITNAHFGTSTAIPRLEAKPIAKEAGCSVATVKIAAAEMRGQSARKKTSKKHGSQHR